MELADLYQLSTPDLCRLAHAVAEILRARAGMPERLLEEDLSEAREMHETLIAAGPKGVVVNGFRLTLVPVSLQS